MSCSSISARKSRARFKLGLSQNIEKGNEQRRMAEMATASKCAKNSKKRASLRESKLGAKLVCWFGARVGLTVREKKWEVSERERKLSKRTIERGI